MRQCAQRWINVFAEYLPQLVAVNSKFEVGFFQVLSRTGAWCSVPTSPGPTCPGDRRARRPSWTLSHSSVAPCQSRPTCTCPFSAGRKRGEGGARRLDIDPRTPPGSASAWWPSMWHSKSWGNCCQRSHRTRSCPRSRSCDSLFVTSPTSTTCWMFRLRGDRQLNDFRINKEYW